MKKALVFHNWTTKLSAIAEYSYTEIVLNDS